MVNYTCLSCGHKFDIEYTSWKPTTTCQKCKKTARMTSTLASKRKVNLFFKKYKDVTAFGYDEHGKEVAIDTKGNRIEPILDILSIAILLSSLFFSYFHLPSYFFCFPFTL